MKDTILKALVLVLGPSLIAGVINAQLDSPHSGINDIGCKNCHFPHNTTDKFLNVTQQVPQDIDDTPVNNLCWSCHNDIVAPYVRTHSSITTESSYWNGSWSMECRQCHWPHQQMQVRTYGSESYLYSSTSTSITNITLTKVGAGWTTDQYKGLVVIPNTAKKEYNYKITGNTNDTLTIAGPIDLTRVTAGDTFAIVYGKLIKSTLLTPNSGPKTVKFFQDTGNNSFADGDSTYNGVCEACHTKTDHHRNDDSGGDHTHNVGLRCTSCHSHVSGFKAMGGGVHPTHVTEEYGPKIACASGDTGCHGTNDPPVLRDGGNLTNTTVCNDCHSSNNVATAKQYWNSSPGSSTGADGSWAVNESYGSFCGSCHDETPGMADPDFDGTGDLASNVTGDDSTYGFFVTGHGKESDNYTSLSWQDTSANGNPGANRTCSACHELTSTHYNNSVKRLKSGYENDNNNTICQQCHEHGGVARNGPVWYTTYAAFQDSAHYQKAGSFGTDKCTACHDVHGAAGAYTAMTKGGKESLCYQCHTDGGVENDALSNNRPGGYVSADDIQEAFSKSEKHNIGVSFTINSKNYTLECVSCHNVHIVTGKYWDAEQGNVSPITRFTDNTEVWGDEPGERMNDFAAGGAGSGGWYYSKARGGTISFDQGGKYQPPKNGSSWDWEFGGNVLPDYPTFCLDCHTNRVSDANPPVNWGQGIGCTGNSVDPPDQRIACNAPHGLGSANQPYYGTDPGTWGSNGNPDPIFGQDWVTRGRGRGHWMRWPYESAIRNAGANFVMSCTDCHEAHGSNRGSMIRERFNVNANGDCGTGGDSSPNGENCADGGNWNAFCNACHYYYGGQHDDMSCGSASCHETNSIHRIIKNGEYSGGSYLWGEPSRPTTTPEIDTVKGHIGSNNLTVNFTEGVWTNRNQTDAVVAGDFLLTDVGGNNPRTITSIIHTPGSSTTNITMSAPLVEADLDNDILATRGVSIWDADGDPAGPWPVAITGPPRVGISTVEGISGYDKLHVAFSESVYANNNGTGNLEPADFTLTDSDNARTIISVNHTAGALTAILTLSSPLDETDDVGTDTLAAVSNSIYDAYGTPANTSPVTITQLPSPSILKVVGAVGSTKLEVVFSDFVYANANKTGTLEPADFNLTDVNGDNPRTITAVEQDYAGYFNATITMSSPLNASDIGVDILAAAGGSIYNADGYPAGIENVTITTQPAPYIIAVTGAVGYDRLKVRLSNSVYADKNKTGSLQPSDFIFTDTDNNRNITSIIHTQGSESWRTQEDIAWLILDSPLDSTSDIGVDTLAANGIYNYLDNPVNTSPVTITDMPVTIITGVEGFAGGTKLKVNFSHWVYANINKTGALEPADFVLTDANNDNNRIITAVQHSVGDTFAILNMSSPLIGADIGNDTVAAAQVSIFNSDDHPVGTTAVAITGQTAPSITGVEGTVGLDKLLVTFSEGVYTNTNQSGALQPSDFVFTDSDNGRTILSVNHSAGTAAAILTLDSAMDSSNDIGTDTIAAASSAIYNRLDNSVSTSAVTVSGNDCPVGGTRFNFDEPAGSSTVNDTTNLLVGQVGNSTYSMRGDGLYYGDENETVTTYIDVNNNNQCLKSPRALTLEARVYVGDVSMDYVDETPANGLDDDYDEGLRVGDPATNNDGDGRNQQATRVAERQATFLFTISHANWAGHYGEDMHDKAQLQFKYRVTDRGTCDGTYPGDSTGEDSPVDGAWFKQIFADVDQYPISSYHWYQIKIVFNTDKPRTVVDLFIDDQGTDGNDTGEVWSGYKNAAYDPETSGCKWAALPGLVMNTANKNLAIGDNLNHNDVPGDKGNTQLKGKLDWFEWKPIADYSGVDDPPY